MCIRDSLRDTANFGFILSEEVFDVILPGLGIGLKGSGGVVTTVFAPCEGCLLYTSLPPIQLREIH